MRILFEGVGTSYDEAALKCLSAHGDTKNCKGRELVDILRASLVEGIREFDCIILHSLSSVTAAGVIELAQRVQYPATLFPRVILLSSLLTWEGCSSGIEASKRTPASFLGTQILKVENHLMSVAKKRGHSVFVIGVGLLYGGSGYDFGEYFQTWLIKII